ncbi:ATP-binding cassette domain-containing protein [Mucilaginibacter robiniae]|uniref:ATP-binding cassette domain-containing protein n=1 Tax=Mucilaginibacter robiniae TaxID=2728022 RepID=A0A7L5DZF0_9SPHI|nr:ATP-binding cassette domain-containing protein [Mucilaginibacter robiniae]QJD95598.1 ATP-binding cassette domain-containing protein [Mucilaginibacter robiniae]
MIKISVRKKLHLAHGSSMLSVDAELPAQAFTALYGPSGAGKTTLLKIIAGLLQPEEGIIEVNGETWLNTHRKINMPIQKRSIGFVFQDFALFPNMTVRENLLYALPNRKQTDVIESLLTKVHLKNLANRKPDTLSSGQKQRVALIRALMRKPQLLLLDEPLSALDDAMRQHLQQELTSFYQEYGMNVLIVSHHLPEIIKLSNQVLQLEGGQLIKAGTPDMLFNLEQNPDQLQLIGEVLSVDEQQVKLWVEHSMISIPLSDNTALWKAGDKVTIACHTRDLRFKKLS